MIDFITALGLVLVIEGLLWALVPNAVLRFMVQMSQQPENSLRLAGALAVAAGVFIVWMARG